jgi:hypothetical protein
VFRYDGQGRLETSSEFEEGWSIDAFFYVDGGTLRPLRQMPPGFEGEIWGAYTASSQVVRTGGKTVREGASTGFFVGTEEQFHAAGQRRLEQLLRERGLDLRQPPPPRPAPSGRSASKPATGHGEPDSDAVPGSAN